MGRFRPDEFGGYYQIARFGRTKIRLVLDCGFAGPDQTEQHLSSCEAIAAHVYDRLNTIVDKARHHAARRCIGTANVIREAEGRKPMKPDELERRLRLMDVCVSPNDLVVTFSARAYEDEHSLFRVRCGPRGGIRDAYIE